MKKVRKKFKFFDDMLDMIWENMIRKVIDIKQ